MKNKNTYYVQKSQYRIVIMDFSGLETLVFTLEFGNNWVLCQVNWVSIPKFLKIIEYLLKTYGYFTRILLYLQQDLNPRYLDKTSGAQKSRPLGRFIKLCSKL